MLEIFNEYHLNKYITSPCAPLVDPLHPTLDESLDMIHNLRTINLIIRGSPRNLIGCLPTLDCVCTLQSHPFTFLQLACFTFRCSYTLTMLA